MKAARLLLVLAAILALASDISAQSISGQNPIVTTEAQSFTAPFAGDAVLLLQIN
jgi:hypothetical protein